MINTIHSVPAQETLHHPHHKIVCWKSILSGLVIATMAYMILAALGAGIGGLIEQQNGSGLGTFAGVWLGISAAASLFLGAFFSQRISNYVTPKVGVINGLLIGSLFFILMVWGAGHLGILSQGLTSTASVNTTTTTVSDAQVIADAGWSLFVTFVVGIAASVVGGIEGSKANRERPLTKVQTSTTL